MTPEQDLEAVHACTCDDCQLSVVAFEAWRAEVDPEGVQDPYGLALEWAERRMPLGIAKGVAMAAARRVRRRWS